jgi:hypothetical protein
MPLNAAKTRKPNAGPPAEIIASSGGSALTSRTTIQRP